MREQWVKKCVELASKPASFWSGARKIHTGLMVEIDGPLSGDFRIEDSGFTRTKLSMLRRLYWEDDHASKVAELWRGRVDRDKYGSVGASTYHHLTKADPAKRSKRASVMGPCLLGVTFTLLNDRSVVMDAFYRTTEFCKKWAADAVFIREVVAPAIGVNAGQVATLRCHFANLTMHTMYWVTVIPHLRDPIAEWEQIRRSDEKFWLWSVKWTSRYILDEYAHGIQKFAQALRVAKDARARIDARLLKRLQLYCRKHHPGIRGCREEPIDEVSDLED